MKLLPFSARQFPARLGRIFAVFTARNTEFFADRGAMLWNFALPFLMAVVFSFALSDERAEYTVGVIGAPSEAGLTLPYMDTVAYPDVAAGLTALETYKIDLLWQVAAGQYWYHPAHRASYFAAQALRAEVATSDTGQAETASAPRALEAIPLNGAMAPYRYVDWVIPGILGINMMFSCLFGVGYTVVRYRRSGVLKRLQATPLTAMEFLIAQVASRLFISLITVTILFAGLALLLGVPMAGRVVDLLLVAVAASLAMIAVSLLVVSFIESEELVGGLLNMVSWPMMFVSGVWFSVEAAPAWVHGVAALFPLTHALSAARAVMLDGAGILDIWAPLAVLLAMSAVFLAVGAALFRWQARA